MIWDYLSLIFKDIKGRKFSSFLTFFAISLGILTIFVIVLVSQGFEQSIEKEFEKMGSNRMIIQAEGGSVFGGQFKKGLTQTEVDLLENKPYIKDVQPHIFKLKNVEYASEVKNRGLLGVEFTQEYFEDYNVEIEEGRFPKENDRFGLVIGPEIAENGYKKEIGIGSNIYIEDRKFKVIGILKSVGNPEDDSQIYMNIETARDIFELNDQVDIIFATVEDSYDVKLAAQNAEILLENKLGDDTVSVQTFDEMLKQFNTILGLIQATLGGIALVSLVVGAVGIINTMFVIITEKTKDIGIMKAIGATNSDIFLLYVIQAGVFGFLGAILGVTFGAIMGKLFEAFLQSTGYTFLTITINPMPVISLLIFGFVIGAISGFIPAYRASKLLIVDTFKK